MTDDRHEDDGVGYGKPPKRSRWQPGQSGNRSGRPAKVPNTRDEAIRRAANKIARVRENGEVRDAPLSELIYDMLFRKAAAGDLNAAKLVLTLMEKAQAYGERPMTETELRDEVIREHGHLIDGLKRDLEKYYDPDYRPPPEFDDDY